MQDNNKSASSPVSFAPISAFSDSGMDQTIRAAKAQIQALYKADYLPWVIGYSGGKDSTATLQLIWNAIHDLPPQERNKTINVISTDTLVENPIVAMWVENSLGVMKKSASEQNMPIIPHRLTPKVEDSFWVNLIGRGYPAPRKMFRWCTSRLKIEPSNSFISNMLNVHGEAIVVLGTREAESNTRKKSMEVYAKGSTRSDFNLSRNSNPKLDRCWIYTPIRHWTNDDVWEYLCTETNPWGVPNSDLMTMYRDGTKDRECPLVVDSTTPSCGDSRFGCFVCTLVEKDKSMSAMIQNDEEKRWMQPLSDFRNQWLDIGLEQSGEDGTSAREREWKQRDFRRMGGNLTLMARGEGLENTTLVHGPYVQSHRANLLRAVLQAQMSCREKAPAALSNFRVISNEELQEIRHIWLMEKFELEDLLPGIYEEVTREPYFDKNAIDGVWFGSDDFHLLREVVGELISDPEEAELHYQSIRELVFVEQQFQASLKRSGIYEQLTGALVRTAWTSENEALDYARQKERIRRSSAEEVGPSGPVVTVVESEEQGGAQ